MVKKKKPSGPQDASGPLMSDVARLAGVAISTVSRALANPGRVNEETRQRIAAAAEQLGYTPNAAARNLRVGKSSIVMIVLPGPLFYGASQIIPEVLHSIDSALVKEGFNLLVSNLDRLAETERHIVDLAFGGTVRGAIVLSSDLPTSGNRSLADAGIPIVSLLRDLSDAGVPSVVTNDRAAMLEATRRLIALGHRRFFYVPGPVGNYHDIERYAGVVDALAEAGFGEDAVIRFGESFEFQEGFECGRVAATALLALAERPTAAICISDDIAIALMHAARLGGLRIPEDLSVVGFDGAAVGEYCMPGLTTMRQPTGALGAAAAAALLALMEQAEAPDARIVLPSDLVERGSIAPAAVTP